MTRGGHKRNYITQQGGTLQRVRGDNPARAPLEPEYRPEPGYPVSPAPKLTAEDIARQLREDPEWQQWMFEEDHGVLY